MAKFKFPALGGHYTIDEGNLLGFVRSLRTDWTFLVLAGLQDTVLVVCSAEAIRSVLPTLDELERMKTAGRWEWKPVKRRAAAA